jgi:DNA-directed RNA polymerase subunit RPC12/RpoP
MRYLFYCKECEDEITLEFSMKDDEGRNNAKCPTCGSSVERRWSLPMISVKKDIVSGVKTKNSFAYNGEEVSFGFADHGKMDGLSKDSVGKRMKGARVDEKTGRLVIDVVSNVKDPLGKLEKMKKETIKKSVNQKIKVRK